MTQSTTQQSYSLETAIATIERLAEAISSDHRIAAIIHIDRGGMVPGRYFAKHLNVRRTYSIGMESYADQKQGTMEVYQELPTDLDCAGTFLIVDDIVDSGQSLQVAVDHARARGVQDIVTCALHKKPGCAVEPDYCGHEVAGDVWITYDWE